MRVRRTNGSRVRMIDWRWCGFLLYKGRTLQVSKCLHLGGSQSIEDVPQQHVALRNGHDILLRLHIDGGVVVPAGECKIGLGGLLGWDFTIFLCGRPAVVIGNRRGVQIWLLRRSRGWYDLVTDRRVGVVTVIVLGRTDLVVQIGGYEGGDGGVRGVFEIGRPLPFIVDCGYGGGR